MTANRLTELLKQAQGNRSQNEYATQAGISPASLTRILKGERMPSPKILEKLAAKAHNEISFAQLMEASGYLDSYLSADNTLTPIDALQAYSLDNKNENEGSPSLVKNIQLLCRQRGISVPRLGNEFGFGGGAIYNWDKNSPSIDKIQKVADYFNVTMDDLVYGQHLDASKKSKFTTRFTSIQDERILAEDLEAIIESLDEAYGISDTPEDEEDRELLKTSLLTSMKLAKQIARKKSSK